MVMAMAPTCFFHALLLLLLSLFCLHPSVVFSEASVFPLLSSSDPDLASHLLFVTAQPDIPFMHWQLEVMGSNLQKHGIPPRQIVMLMSRTVEMELRELDKTPSSELIARTPPLSGRAKCLASIYRVHDYVDTRPSKDRYYLPSMRLNLWRKFYREFEKELQPKYIFYHDADIIFTHNIPDFGVMVREARRVEKMQQKKKKEDVMPLGAYVSDTSDYTGENMLVNLNGVIFSTYFNDGRDKLDYVRTLCSKMTRWETEACVSNTTHKSQTRVGGAQYFFMPNRLSAEFWEVAYDMTLDFYNAAEEFTKESFPRGDMPPEADGQASWKADMHGLMWALWSQGLGTRNHPEMDFAWAVHDTFYKKGMASNAPSILHMAGASDQACQGGGKGDRVDRSTKEAAELAGASGRPLDPYGGHMCHFNKGQHIGPNLSPLRFMCHNGIEYWNHISYDSNSRVYLRDMETTVALHSDPPDEEVDRIHNLGACFLCDGGEYVALTDKEGAHWTHGHPPSSSGEKSEL